MRPSVKVASFISGHFLAKKNWGKLLSPKCAGPGGWGVRGRGQQKTTLLHYISLRNFEYLPLKYIVKCLDFG